MLPTKHAPQHAKIFAQMSPHIKPWLDALQQANDWLPESMRFSKLHYAASQNAASQNSDLQKIAVDSFDKLQQLPVFAFTVVVQKQAILGNIELDSIDIDSIDITNSDTTNQLQQQQQDLNKVVKDWAQNNPLWQVIEVAHSKSPIITAASKVTTTTTTNNNSGVDNRNNDRLTPVQTFRYVLLPTQAAAMSAEKTTAAAHMLDEALTAHLRHFINTLPVTVDMGGDAAIDCHIVSLAEILRPHRIAYFDMDSTLIEQEVIVALAKQAGVESEVNKITESAMRGEIDFDTSLGKRMALLAGLSISLLPNIYDTLSLSAGARTTITALKALGYYTVLISGGFSYFAEKIAAELGIDEVHANHLDIDEGLLTGHVIAPIINKERKAELVKKIAKLQGVEMSQTVCIGDGANDLAMMAVADLGIAYHAKPIVRARADAAINATGLEGVLYVLGYDSTAL